MSDYLNPNQTIDADVSGKDDLNGTLTDSISDVTDSKSPKCSSGDDLITENESSLFNDGEDDTNEGKAKKLSDDIQSLTLVSHDQETTPTVNGDNKPSPGKGERILIEKDGRFELVDATAVKAEFFDMLGLSMAADDQGGVGSVEEEKPSSSSDMDASAVDAEDKTDAKEDTTQTERPHTSPVRSSNRSSKLKSEPPANRSQSAAVRTRMNAEYNGARSKYGMTDQQLEMKKKREEALLRRRKEEDQRRKEEVERKREDAERAFQAWLHSKNTEALERRKMSAKDQNKDDKEKEESAQRAYQAWLNEKAKQIKQEKFLEKCRLEEEASSYVIRDRNLCEAAFQSWLKKKRVESNSKKPKRSKKKKSHGRDTQSSKASVKRLSDYYGYRNTLSA